jgi:hypothetical protein
MIGCFGVSIKCGVRRAGLAPVPSALTKAIKKDLVSSGLPRSGRLLPPLFSRQLDPRVKRTMQTKPDFHYITLYWKVNLFWELIRIRSPWKL